MTTTTLGRRLGDWLFTAEPAKRFRLQQAALANLLMLVSVAALAYAAHFAGTPMLYVLSWAGVSVTSLVVFFVLIHTGWSRRLADPSLTLPQMVAGLTSAAGAYAMAGSMRGGVFPVVMVILMFGMFQLRPRQVSQVSLYALLLFGGVMALMAGISPLRYEPAAEAGHFFVLVAMLPAMSLLAARLTRLRERSRRQRRDLAEALARIQDLATRDELTGLINRRHMNDLLEQERQRCSRSGRGFCVALVDVDHFKQINDRHGHAAGDDVLRRFAREALVAIRASDVLARWGGEEFVLLLADAHLPMARGGCERLRQRVESATMLGEDPRHRITVSIGLTEHIAGETVVAALARADFALYEAKAQGRNRTVVAGGAVKA